jgi:DNA polymerase epsilon subunit 1
VRTACHLLALDATVADQVALLRRRLLKLLAVGEFGGAAQFREPCMSFRLPDVICG